MDIEINMLTYQMMFLIYIKTVLFTFIDYLEFNYRNLIIYIYNNNLLEDKNVYNNKNLN